MKLDIIQQRDCSMLIQTKERKTYELVSTSLIHSYSYLRSWSFAWHQIYDEKIITRNITLRHLKCIWYSQRAWNFSKYEIPSATGMALTFNIFKLFGGFSAQYRWLRARKSRHQNEKKIHNAAWVLVFMRFYFICFTLKSFKFLNDKLVSFPFRLTMALNVLQSSNIGFWTWVGNNTLFYELYVLNLKWKKVNWVKIL